MKNTCLLWITVLVLTGCSQKKELASTPPLGWNSYTGYSTVAPESELIKNIDAVAKKLKPYGYEYVTVDNGWFMDKKNEDGGKVLTDEFGLPESSPVFFPSGVKWVINYTHKKGLKFGIWLIRGVDRKAVKANLPIEGTPYHLQDIADTTKICDWNDFNYGVDMSKPGAQEYYNNLVKKYADWGVDFIKFDDIVPHPDEVLGVVKAIENCGKDIVLSLSPGDYIKVEDSGAYLKANMVRITSDIWDNRGSLETTFNRWEAMQDYKGSENNSWLDMDMICFGRLYVVENGGWICKFTEDQKRTFMLQRALAASPLIAGGVLYSMDDFSLSLLTHEDILECDQNGVVGKLVHREGKIDVWKTLKKGRKAGGQEGKKAGGQEEKNKSEKGDGESGWIGVFNRDGVSELAIDLSLEDLGLEAETRYNLKEIWGSMDLKDGKCSFLIPADGCVFLKYTQR